MKTLLFASAILLASTAAHTDECRAVPDFSKMARHHHDCEMSVRFSEWGHFWIEVSCDGQLEFDGNLEFTNGYNRFGGNCYSSLAEADQALRYFLQMALRHGWVQVSGGNPSDILIKKSR